MLFYDRIKSMYDRPEAVDGIEEYGSRRQSRAALVVQLVDIGSVVQQDVDDIYVPVYLSYTLYSTSIMLFD